MSSPSQSTSLGRGWFWAGIAAFVFGWILVAVQYFLGYLFLPWQMPVLSTIGVVLLVASAVKRRTIPRLVFLGLIALVGGLQWLFVAVLSVLPVYEGPAQVGRKMPAFQTVLADGRPLTERDFADGSRRVLTFFRGRW